MSQQDAPEIGLGDVEQLITQLQGEAQRNLTSLEQAVEAMRNGDVGSDVIAHYEQIVDLATQIAQAAEAADFDLEGMRTVADAYAAVPSAGDTHYLKEEG